MTILEELFNRRWIVKQKDKELYYQIRDQLPKYQKFLNEKMGYRVLLNPHVIKLEKVPGNAEPWMGIQQFTSSLEYQFFCLILMFLEDMEPGRQFVLSELTEFVRNHYPGEPIVWEEYHKRRYLIRTMKYCFEEQLILHHDGSQSQYLQDETQDVLYENTGLSRYYMRHLNQPITTIESIDAIDFQNESESVEDRGLLRRQRVYRKLVLEMGVHKTDETDEDFLYIKNYRNILEQDLSAVFQASLHIHKNSAYLVLDEDGNLGRTFPDRSNLSEIILLVNRKIRENVAEKRWYLDANDHIFVTPIEFENLIARCKEEFQDRFTKGFQNQTTQEFVAEVLQAMQRYNMITLEEEVKSVVIHPICGKIVGYYEEEFDGD